MSFPYANEASVSVSHFGITGASLTVTEILGTLPLPGFMVGRPVDVTGMEVAIAISLNGATTHAGQAIASGASTTVFKPYDGGTSASAATGNNLLVNLATNLEFSNSVTGGWTAHQAKKNSPTSTTDLDADDWVNLDVAANAAAAGGAAEIVMGAFFLYGVPGSIA